MLPGAGSMGTYVPMGGLSGRTSPEHSDSYNASQSNFAGAGPGPYGGQPQPVYPAGTPYGQVQGWGAGEGERFEQRGRLGGFGR